LYIYNLCNLIRFSVFIFCLLSPRVCQLLSSHIVLLLSPRVCQLLSSHIVLNTCRYRYFRISNLNTCHNFVMPKLIMLTADTAYVRNRDDAKWSPHLISVKLDSFMLVVQLLLLCAFDCLFRCRICVCWHCFRCVCSQVHAR
jgi:hypothetical protein